jgi:hypothetical protein
VTSRLSKIRGPLVGALVALALVACSASTAHIGSLKVGKDKDVATETATFGAHDTIYAVASADNLPNAVTMKWQLVAVNVKGQQPNAAIPSLDMSKDLTTQDNSATYTLTPPPAGWPAGDYKIVVTMMDNGTQRDQKSATFSVGAGTAGATDTTSGGTDNSAASPAPAGT